MILKLKLRTLSPDIHLGLFVMLSYNILAITVSQNRNLKNVSVMSATEIIGNVPVLISHTRR